MTTATTYPHITGETPGCLLFLVDQSGSTEEVAASTGRPIKEEITDVVNAGIRHALEIARKGRTIREHFHIGVIGYGSEEKARNVHNVRVGSLIDPKACNEAKCHAPLLATLPDLHAHQSITTIQLADGPYPQPYWVKSYANGMTPMAAAFDKAREIAAQWSKAHPRSRAPIIFNITDGLPNEPGMTIGSSFDVATKAASALAAVKTDLRILQRDGTEVGSTATLYNLHTTPARVTFRTAEDKDAEAIPFPTSTLLFPSHENEFSSLTERDGRPADARAIPYVRRLWQMSTRVPAFELNSLADLTKDLNEASRAFALNASPTLLKQIVKSGTPTPRAGDDKPSR